MATTAETAPNKDAFHIWERLLQSIRKELRDDRDGIVRNLAHIADLEGRNAWLQLRIDENEIAEALIAEQVSA